MITWLKSYWSKFSPEPKQKIRLSTLTTYADTSTKEYHINDWIVTYTFGVGPAVKNMTDGSLLRTILDPKYKACWSGDVFAVKVILRSGDINERNYP